MSMDVGAGKGGPMAAINVTPLADVMIVLLIIFMVITPLLNRVDARLPNANQTKEHPDKQKSVSVAILANGKIQFNTSKDIKLTELAGLVKQRFDELGEDEKVLYLKADAGLPYADIMKVMDSCREGGVEQVAFIAEKKVEG